MDKKLKHCSMCAVEKPLDEFHRNSRAKDRRQSSCKTCKGEYARRWQEENLEKHRENGRRWHKENSEKSRRSKILRRYGIALEVYDTHMALGCKICGGHKNMHMDHDHSTGKLRGALCASCNKAIGNMEDNPARLEAAAAYLRSST